MSLHDLIKSQSWLRTTYSPGYLATRQALRISQQAAKTAARPSFLDLDLGLVLAQLAEKTKLLKLAALRQDFEEFTVKEVEAYEYSPSDSGAEQAGRIIIDEGGRIAELIKDIYNNNNQLYALSSREFEEVIAALLREQGFQAELTKQTRDGGYDILAVQHLRGNHHFRVLVECKKYDSSRKIGVGIVRSFCHVVAREGANKGIIATTSFFTKPATAEPPHPYLLDFRDKDAILEWVRSYAVGY